MLVRLDESHRELVHRLRDEAGEWLSTKCTDQYRGGLDMKAVHEAIDREFGTEEFYGWSIDGEVVAVIALIEPDADFWSAEELAEPQFYISRVLVAEQGKGYGRALLEALRIWRASRARLGCE